MRVLPRLEMFASCPDCQTSLVEHMRTIAAERDRTKLGGALLGMFGDVFRTGRGALFRCVRHKGRRFAIALAEQEGGRLETHDAYLLSPARGLDLPPEGRLARCADSGAALGEWADGGHVAVFPVFQKGSLHLLLEIQREAAFGEAEMILARRLLDYFSDHLELIDYAETDTLTGLLNRKTFDEHLDRILATASDDSGAGSAADHPLRRQAKRTEAHNWLAIIDIDHFKRVNDTHGHLIGDEVLLLIAQKMQESFRLDDQLFRFGGEEFVTVLQPTGLVEARMVLDRFRRAVEAHPFPLVGRVTASVGFTRITYYDNPPDLVDRADKALYYAKEHGRNRVESYEALHQAKRLGADPTRQKSDVELF